MVDSASEEQKRPAVEPLPSAAATQAAHERRSTEPQAAATQRKQAIEQAEADAAADHARWLALSPAQRCFSDGLALAFSHLTLAELMTAARCCKSWYEGAKRVPGSSLGVGVSLLRHVARRSMSDSVSSAAPRLLNFASSPFRHLIRELCDSINGEATKAPSVWRLADLRLLQRLPHITRLSGVTISLSSHAQASNESFIFPTQLQSVDLEFFQSAWVTSIDYRLVLQALSACPSLTDVTLASRQSVSWDLTPLLQLQRLRHLKLCYNHPFQFDKPTIAVMKQLASLESLTIGGQLQLDDNAWLTRLCQPPHRLQQLQKIDLSQVCLEDAQMQALRHLPALTTLEPDMIRCSCLPYLAHFPALRRLHIWSDRWGIANQLENGEPEFFDARGFTRASFFLPHLTCTQLQVLTLRSCVFTDAEAEALCQLLLQLMELTLDDVDWPSFHPLRHLTKLTALEAYESRDGDAPLDFTLEQLQALRSLRTLHLGQLQPALDDATLTALHPPSLLMPSLTFLKYEPLQPRE